MPFREGGREALPESKGGRLLFLLFVSTLSKAGTRELCNTVLLCSMEICFHTDAEKQFNLLPNRRRFLMESMKISSKISAFPCGKCCTKMWKTCFYGNLKAFFVALPNPQHCTDAVLLLHCAWVHDSLSSVFGL